eukprot:Opistho-2@2269
MSETRVERPRFGGQPTDRLSVFQRRWMAYEEALRTPLKERQRAIGLVEACEANITARVSAILANLFAVSPGLNIGPMDSAEMVRIAIWSEYGIVARALEVRDASERPSFAAQLDRVGARTAEASLEWLEEIMATLAPTVAARLLTTRGLRKKETLDIKVDDDESIERYRGWLNEVQSGRSLEYKRALIHTAMANPVIHIAEATYPKSFQRELAETYGALRHFMMTRFGRSAFGINLLTKYLELGGVEEAIVLLRQARDGGQLESIFGRGEKGKRIDGSTGTATTEKSAQGGSSSTATQNGRAKASKSAPRAGESAAGAQRDGGSRKESSSEKDGGSERQLRCWVCESPEHRARDCPVKRARGGATIAAFAAVARDDVPDLVTDSESSDDEDDEPFETWTHDGTIVIGGAMRKGVASVLFDSGASTCGVSHTACRRFNIPVKIPDVKEVPFRGVGKGVVRPVGRVDGDVEVRIGEHGTTQLRGVRVFEDLPGQTDVLLGYGRLKKMGVLGAATVAAMERGVDATFADIVGASLASAKDDRIGVDDAALSVWLPDGECTTVNRDDFKHLTAAGVPDVKVDKVVVAINERGWRDGARLGMAFPPAELKLKEGAPPARISYPLRSPAKRAALRADIEKALKGGLIRRLTRAEARRVRYVTVPSLSLKPDGTYRMAIDYRNINGFIEVGERTEIPREDEYLSRLAENCVFSVMDAVKGYWQRRLSPESQLLTAFQDTSADEYVVYVWLVLPFGITNAGDLFQDAMSRCLRETRARAYIDDIGLGSKSYAWHVEELLEVLAALRERNVFLRIAKCQFFKSEVIALGRQVSAAGVTVPESAMQGIRDLAVPKGRDDVRSAYQALTWWARFVPNFAIIGAPISDLLKSERRFKWGPDQQAAYDALKEAICSAKPVLPPDYTHPMVLTTDASRVGVGAVLYRTDDGDRRVVACASAKWSAAEANYRHTGELEALGIVWGALKFETYLSGVSHPFVVETDHQPLVTLFGGIDKISSSVTKRRIRRWAEILSQFKFRIRHVPGTEMGMTDALSRLPTSHDALLERKGERIIAAASAASADALAEAQAVDVNAGTLTAVPAEQDGRRRKAIEALVRIIHEQLSHAGTTRVEAHVRARYTDWDDVRNIVRMVVRTCQVCQAAGDAREHETIVPLRPLPIVTRPLERVAIDLLSLVRSTGGARYVFGAQDAATKFMWLVPMTSKASEDVVLVFMANILPWGVPARVQHDAGSEFDNDVFAAFCKSYAIERHMTSIDRPQANGQIERGFSTAIDWMRKDMAHHQTERWEYAVARVANAYNNSVSSTTGKTPYELMRGELPQLPVDRQIGWKPVVRYVDEAQLRERLTAAQAVQRAVADKRATILEAPTYVKGDMVMVRVRSGERKNKTAARWSGPFPIEGEAGPDKYEARTGRRCITAHVSDLKRHEPLPTTPQEDVASADLPAPPLETGGALTIPAAADAPDRTIRMAGTAAFTTWVWTHPWAARAGDEDVTRTRKALSTKAGRAFAYTMGSPLRGWMAYCGSVGRDAMLTPTAEEMDAWVAREGGQDSTKSQRRYVVRRAYRFVDEPVFRAELTERFLGAQKEW